jgi:hypothetical protein
MGFLCTDRNSEEKQNKQKWKEKRITGMVPKGKTHKNIKSTFICLLSKNDKKAGLSEDEWGELYSLIDNSFSTSDLVEESKNARQIGIKGEFELREGSCVLKRVRKGDEKSIEEGIEFNCKNIYVSLEKREQGFDLVSIMGDVGVNIFSVCQGIPPAVTHIITSLQDRHSRSPKSPKKRRYEEDKFSDGVKTFSRNMRDYFLRIKYSQNPIDTDLRTRIEVEGVNWLIFFNLLESNPSVLSTNFDK